MRLASLLYVPKLDRLYPRFTLQNFRAFKTHYPIIYYSDYGGAGYEDFLRIPAPDAMKQSKNKTATQNYLFLHGLRIAKELQLDRFIFLENDCRVGRDYWDSDMFDEVDHQFVVAGTPNLFNTQDFPKEHWPALHEYMSAYTAKTGLPVAQFLCNEKTRRLGSCMFQMGAGAVYDTERCFELFPGFETCIGSYACRTAAFDLHIGLKMFQQFGTDALKWMPFLTKSFSGFGNKVLNLEQRKERLLSGKACLIHQFKEKDDLLKGVMSYAQDSLGLIP